MRERPILFSAPMVRAILDGRKTQTRRAVKLLHANPLGQWEPTTWGGTDAHGIDHPEQAAIWHTRTGDTIACPYGVVGDRLWVREAWAYFGGDEYLYQQHLGSVAYRADGHYVAGLDAIPGGRWRPSIHMPRWASRIALAITDVRVERLQDISHADAVAEGCGGQRSMDPELGSKVTPREDYRRLWDSINGPGGWDANPWVWVVAFRRVTQ